MRTRFAKSIACCGVIFLISALPGERVPEVPVWNFDKLVHAFVYFWMTVFLYSDLGKAGDYRPKRAVSIAVLFSIVYGGVLELLQNVDFINRSGNWVDFSANALGAFLAAAVILALNSNRRRYNLRPKNFCSSIYLSKIQP